LKCVDAKQSLTSTGSWPKAPLRETTAFDVKAEIQGVGFGRSKQNIAKSLK
jgi:hypothetical protein